MKEFTARYAHMESLPIYHIGDVVREGMVIGKMGNTGQSRGAHLHIDVVEGYIKEMYHLYQIGIGDNFKYTPSKTQLDYFIDHALFDSKYKIATKYNDPEYKKLFNKEHPAIDIYPTEGYAKWDIYWNRTKLGVVLNKGFDEKGYGNFIQIGYIT